MIQIIVSKLMANITKSVDVTWEQIVKWQKPCKACWQQIEAKKWPKIKIGQNFTRFLLPICCLVAYASFVNKTLIAYTEFVTNLKQILCQLADNLLSICLL